jgi:hypothetical protein
VAHLGYALYDGSPVLSGDTLSAMELFVASGAGSRILPRDAARVLARADLVSEYLAAIPGGVRLADATEAQLVAGGDLLDLLGAPYGNTEKLTKALARKRPDFFPVLDDSVRGFLRQNFPHRVSARSDGRAYLELFREIHNARASALARIRVAVGQKGLRLSSVRLLSHLIALGWQRPRPSRFEGGERPPGTHLTQVWGVTTQAEAVARAEVSWEEQRAETALSDPSPSRPAGVVS